MKLHSIPHIKGEKQSRKRLGKGQGSGRGGTSTKGHKGGNARSGYSPSPVYSGIPYYRRLPMRGFSNARFREDIEIVNLKDLEKLEVTEINHEVLLKAKLVSNKGNKIKILGNGSLTKAFIVQADFCSAAAQKKIEAAGGKVIVKEPAKKLAKKGLK